MTRGVDTREFAERVRDASPEERRELMRRWIFEGSRAQGWCAIGFVIEPIAAVALGTLITLRMGVLLAYVACVIALVAGGWLTYLAVKREDSWRETNPFRY